MLPIEKYREQSLREIFRVCDENALPETPPNYPPYYSWPDTDGLKPEKIVRLWKESNKLNFVRIPTIYVHIPFCQYICKFCGFYRKIPTRNNEIDLYLKALKKEAKYYSVAFDSIPIRNLCFGGGTPTILSEKQLEYLFNIFYKNFNITKHTRIAIETSPHTIDYNKALKLKNMGVNYISIGVQSFNEKLMKSLGRPQNAKECIKAIESVKKAGIENVEVDLMVGIPGQTEDIFMDDIRILSKFDLERVYIFDWQPRSFTYGNKSASLDVLNINKVRDWRRKGIEELIRKQNYIMRCGHWIFKRKGEEWPYTYDQQEEEGYSILGLGATSITYCLGRQRYQNVSSVDKYLEFLKQEKLPIANYYQIDEIDEMINYIIVKLLHIGQLVFSHFNAKFNKDPYKIFKDEFDYLASIGILKRSFDSFYITDREKAVFYLRAVFYRDRVLKLISQKSGIKLLKKKNENNKVQEKVIDNSNLIYLFNNPFNREFDFFITNFKNLKERNYRDIVFELIEKKKKGLNKAIFFHPTNIDFEFIHFIYLVLNKFKFPEEFLFLSKNFTSFNNDLLFKNSFMTKKCEFVFIVDKNALDINKINKLENTLHKSFMLFLDEFKLDAFLNILSKLSSYKPINIYVFFRNTTKTNFVDIYKVLKHNINRIVEFLKDKNINLKFINVPFCILYPFENKFGLNLFRNIGDARETSNNIVKLETCLVCKYLLYCPGPSYGYLDAIKSGNIDGDVVYYSVRNGVFFDIKAIK